MLARPDVARVDTVLGKRTGALRILFQQYVAVVVKIADDRNRYAPLAQPFYDVRNRCGSLAGIHSDADKFGACARELLALERGAFDIDGIGVSHRLDNDWIVAAHL